MRIKLYCYTLIAVFLVVQMSCNNRDCRCNPDRQTSGTANIPSSTTFPIPGRPDNLTQANVDQLMSNGEMNFDGLRFDNKRMEFINFNKGSFRGTTFYNTTLNDGVARRKIPEPDKFDFEDANIYVCKLKRVNFTNWKFLRTVFQTDSITDGKFKNCAFTDNKFYTSTILKVTFNNGFNSNFNDVSFYSCNFSGGGFDSLKFINGGFYGFNKFTGFHFNSVEFIDTKFQKIGTLSPFKFTGCNFKNVKFISPTIEGVDFGDASGVLWFENVSFENAVWRNGTANISFNTICKFSGPSTVLQNINFASSVFVDAIFGVQNATYKMSVKQCIFTNCSFPGNTVFYNCNLENSIFPPIPVLQAAGVRFVNCVNAPYNSP